MGGNEKKGMSKGSYLLYVEEGEICMKKIFLRYNNDMNLFCSEINTFICAEIKITEPVLNIVYVTEKPKTKGYYDGKTNTIYVYINKTNINLFDIAHIIIHENIHLLLLSFMLDKSMLVLRQTIGDCNLELSSEYKNLLIIDKLFYNTDWANKPYYYNLDSSELLAEKIAHQYVYETYEELSKKDMRKNIGDLNIDELFSEYIRENDFFLNGDIYMKPIYISENIQGKGSLKQKILMKIYGRKYKTDFFKIENYDIEKYQELYLQAKKEYLKHYRNS